MSSFWIWHSLLANLASAPDANCRLDPVDQALYPFPAASEMIRRAYVSLFASLRVVRIEANRPGPFELGTNGLNITGGSPQAGRSSCPESLAENAIRPVS